ncbi:MAG: glycosyltransferase family 2 protein, partial [Clostridia bacterium]|nr:glycosyltransferase family 2 protein [Clostridia bacterium]
MISVIVPVYKTEEYLNQCVESILNQTYKDLEILLIDDGSPDRCGELCDDFAERDNRIRVFHTENRGVAAARNFGIREAKGEYIGFVDSDDWIEPDMY